MPTLLSQGGAAVFTARGAEGWDASGWAVAGLGLGTATVTVPGSILGVGEVTVSLLSLT